MKKKEQIKAFFESILSFQEDDHADYFMKDEGLFYEIHKKYGDKQEQLKNRVKFHYLCTTKLLPKEDRRGFETGIDIVFDLIEKLVYNIDKERSDKKDLVEIKPKKKKSYLF